MKRRITILGAGAWGTAVANLLASNGHPVTLWCFESEVVDDIIKHRINKKYLSGIELDKAITPTTSLHEAVEGADIIFEAVPVSFLREVLEQVASHVTREQAWVMLSKGIEDTLLFPSMVVEDVLGFTPKLAALTGPNFARQLAEKRCTASLIASPDEPFAQEIAVLCANDYFKPYTSNDCIGAQAGGALKNVISLFIGILEGSGYVENTRAFFFVQGLAELAQFTEHLGGNKEIAYGLAGLGDLSLGLIGKRNRNYELGMRFGKGSSLSDIEAIMEVLPEGINTIRSVQKLITRDKLVLPICTATYQIVYEGRSIRGFVELTLETA